LKAIISDIHSNLEALTVVLEDIQAKGIEEILCLGDVVGYGPNPNECYDLIKQANCRITLMGNHEEGLLTGGEDFNIKARLAVNWTRKQLEEKFASEAAEQTVYDWAKNLKSSVQEDDVMYVHASPRNHTKDYVFPQDVFNEEKMKEVFSGFKKICFNGHTHHPGIFTEHGKFHRPQDIMNVFFLEGEKVLINVGSVGQPRDGDNRASYITFDGESVVFRRLEYDFTRTIEKVYSVDALDNFLGDRLEEGR